VSHSHDLYTYLTEDLCILSV